jgi:hypothetical protein
MTAALGGEWSAACPGRTLPPGKTRFPIDRRLGGPQGRSGRAENLVPTGIRSRTVQPVVSRYTDWATWPTKMANYIVLIMDKYRSNFGTVIPLCLLFATSFHYDREHNTLSTTHSTFYCIMFRQWSGRNCKDINRKVCWDGGFLFTVMSWNT